MRSDMRAKLHAIRDGVPEDGAAVMGDTRPIHIHGNGHTFVFAHQVLADNMHIAVPEAAQEPAPE